MSLAPRFCRTSLSLLATVFFLAGAYPAPVMSADDPPAVAGPSLSTGEARILKALDETTELEFIETPLEEVVQFISQRHRVATYIDSKSLENAGASGQSRISIKLHGLRLRSALRLILKNLDLTFDIHKDVLRICSNEEADGSVYTKVYPIHDLVDRSKRRFLYSEDLVDAITSTIEPQAWGEGNNNGIARFPAVMAIPQSRDVHEQIEQLLDDIRRAKGLESRTPPDKSKSMLAIEQALEMPWDVNATEQPLRVVLNGLAKQFGISVFMDERGLEDNGASFDMHVTVHIERIKLPHALDILMRGLNAELDWTVHDDALWITSREKIESLLITRVYDISDLLDSGRVNDKDELMDAIRNSEAEFHSSWNTDSGPGTLEWLPDVLIVGQTRPVHQFVERLLADLRALPPPPLVPPKEDKVTLKVYHLDGVSAEGMAEIVQRLVEPKSWSGAGGEGVIEAIDRSRAAGGNPNGGTQGKDKFPQPTSPPPLDTDGWLFVRQHDSVHRQIANLLQDMKVLHWWNWLNTPTGSSDK